MLCCVMRFSWATFAVEEEAKLAMPNQDSFFFQSVSDFRLIISHAELKL